MYHLLIFIFFSTTKLRSPNPKSEWTLFRFGSWHPSNPTSQFLLSQLPVAAHNSVPYFPKVTVPFPSLSGNVRNTDSDRPLIDTDNRSFPNQNTKKKLKKTTPTFPNPNFFGRFGHTLTNLFLKKFYRKLKKLSKFFSIPDNFFFQKWYIISKIQLFIVLKA